MHLSKAGLLIAVVTAGGYAAVRLSHPAPHAAVVVETASPPTAAPAAAQATSPPVRVTVYVAGDVGHPGVYVLPSGSRIVDAYRLAGGARPDADPVAIDLAAPVRDGEDIVVPRRGERITSVVATGGAVDAGPSEGASPPAATPRHRKRGRKHRRKHVASPAVDDSAGSTTTLPSIVDVNAASASELETLPGIGPALADRIVRFRDLNGRFASSNELADVAGMTSGKLDAIAPYARY